MSIPENLLKRCMELMGRAPGNTIEELCADLDKLGAKPLAAAKLAPRDKWHPNVQKLVHNIVGDGFALSGHELALILRGMGWAVAQQVREPQIIWTGPSKGTVPVRRTDQVLYDLITSSKKRVLLVTFAALKVPKLIECLEAATARGVEIHLLLETESESEGQLSFDAAQAFPKSLREKATLLHWPGANRTRNQRGRPGKLHAKCAVIDDVAVVSSANLTDDAFNRNMELGLVVKGGKLADSIWDHFSSLLTSGAIRLISK